MFKRVVKKISGQHTNGIGKVTTLRQLICCEIVNLHISILHVLRSLAVNSDLTLFGYSIFFFFHINIKLNQCSLENSLETNDDLILLLSTFVLIMLLKTTIVAFSWVICFSSLSPLGTRDQFHEDNFSMDKGWRGQEGVVWG